MTPRRTRPSRGRSVSFSATYLTFRADAGEAAIKHVIAARPTANAAVLPESVPPFDLSGAWSGASAGEVRRLGGALQAEVAAHQLGDVGDPPLVVLGLGVGVEADQDERRERVGGEKRAVAAAADVGGLAPVDALVPSASEMITSPECGAASADHRRERPSG